MISLAKLSIRRPKAALGGWLVIAIVLITIGFGVSKTMSPSITVVSGTQSAQAQKLADEIAAMPTIESAVEQLLEMT